MTDVILTGYFDPRGVLGKREVTASDTPGTRSGIILMTGAGGVLTPADAIGYPVRGLTETILATQLTDGGAAAGTFQMAGTIPAGAVLVGDHEVPFAMASFTSSTIGQAVILTV